MQRFLVPASQAGQRLDLLLASLMVTTRSHVKLLIQQDRVRIAGQSKKPGYVTRTRDEIEVLPLLPPPTVITPEAIPLDILYEDAFIAAINKPAGMVVHPALGQWHGTVVNALLARWELGETSDSFRPGIVHRLDKDTSGVLLVARDRVSLERLAQQFKQRQVHKTYIAVALGRFAVQSGEIGLPIGRHPVDRKKMSVHARRSRAAVSRYQVVAEAPNVSLVRLFPETGRTHQLRVHLAAIGHPILGDGVYGPRKETRALPALAAAFARQALHAESIRFRHPMSDTVLHLHAPYPADLVALLAALRLPVSAAVLD